MKTQLNEPNQLGRVESDFIVPEWIRVTYLPKQFILESHGVETLLTPLVKSRVCSEVFENCQQVKGAFQVHPMLAFLSKIKVEKTATVIQEVEQTKVMRIVPGQFRLRKKERSQSEKMALKEFIRNYDIASV